MTTNTTNVIEIRDPGTGKLRLLRSGTCAAERRPWSSSGSYLTDRQWIGLVNSGPLVNATGHMRRFATAWAAINAAKAYEAQEARERHLVSRNTCEGCGQEFDELLVKGLCRTCGLASFTQAVEDAKTDQLLEDALGPEQPCITCGEPTGGDRAVCIDCDREQEQDAKATRAKWALRDLEGPTAGAMRVALSEVLSEATVASWRDLAATEGLPAKDRTLCASVAVLLEGMRGDAEQVLSLVESRSAARSAEAFFRT